MEVFPWVRTFHPGRERRGELLQKDKVGAVAPCSLQRRKMLMQEA